MPDTGATAGFKGVHPCRGPRQRRLGRRLNNWLVYRTIRKAIKESGAAGPVLMAPCGYGWFFEKFKCDGIPVVGIDLDPKTIASRNWTRSWGAAPRAGNRPRPSERRWYPPRTTQVCPLKSPREKPDHTPRGVFPMW